MNPIVLPSHVDIGTASELHAVLLQAFRAQDEVEIDAGGVEHADLTSVQLLASAAKSAEASGKPMRVVAVSEPLRNAFTRAGARLSRSDDKTN